MSWNRVGWQVVYGFVSTKTHLTHCYCKKLWIIGALKYILTDLKTTFILWDVKDVNRDYLTPGSKDSSKGPLEGRALLYEYDLNWAIWWCFTPGRVWPETRMGGHVHEPGRTVSVGALLSCNTRTEGWHRHVGQETHQLSHHVHRGRCQWCKHDQE